MKIEKEDIETIPEKIVQHLKKLLEDTDLPQGEEGFQRLAQAWLEKERLFSAQAQALGMRFVERVEREDPGGILVLTSSGSLLCLYPARENGRGVEYASLSLRSDVPDILTAAGVNLAGDVTAGSSVKLENGPIKQSSSAYRVGAFDAELDPDEQEKRLREASIFLTNGFARINKKSRSLEEAEVEHFNKQSMVAYVAKRSGLTQREVQQVIDDYLSVVESGILLGESVNLGKLGRFFLKTRPAQKARIGRNPATGAEMTIPAKPAQAVPKVSFSTYFKERAAEVELDTEGQAGSGESEE